MRAMTAPMPVSASQAPVNTAARAKRSGFGADDSILAADAAIAFDVVLRAGLIRAQTATAADAPSPDVMFEDDSTRTEPQAVMKADRDAGALARQEQLLTARKQEKLDASTLNNSRSGLFRRAAVQQDLRNPNDIAERAGGSATTPGERKGLAALYPDAMARGGTRDGATIRVPTSSHAFAPVRGFISTAATPDSAPRVIPATSTNGLQPAQEAASFARGDGLARHVANVLRLPGALDVEANRLTATVGEKSLARSDVEGKGHARDASGVFSPRHMKEDPALKEVRSAVSTDFQRLVQRMRLQTTPTRSAATLQLHPPELGRVRVEVQFEENMLRIDVRTETERARETLVERAASLRMALAAQGIRVDHFDVTYDFPGHGALAQDEESFPFGSHADSGAPWSEKGSHAANQSSVGGDSAGAESNDLPANACGERSASEVWFPVRRLAGEGIRLDVKV